MNDWNTTSEIIAQCAGGAEFGGTPNRGQNCLDMKNFMRDLQSKVQIITKIVARVSKVIASGTIQARLGTLMSLCNWNLIAQRIECDQVASKANLTPGLKNYVKGSKFR